MAFVSGQNGRVEVTPDGGVASVLCAVRWSVNEKTDENDVSTFCGAGFTEMVPGLKEADISVEGIWGTAGEDPFDDPPNLHPGTLCAVVLKPDNSNDPNAGWTFPTAYVITTSNDTEVRGTVRYTINFKSTGLYSYSGGA